MGWKRFYMNKRSQISEQFRHKPIIVILLGLFGLQQKQQLCHICKPFSSLLFFAGSLFWAVSTRKPSSEGNSGGTWKPASTLYCFWNSAGDNHKWWSSTFNPWYCDLIYLYWPCVPVKIASPLMNQYQQNRNRAIYGSRFRLFLWASLWSSIRVVSRLPGCWQKLSCELAELKIYYPMRTWQSRRGWVDGWTGRRMGGRAACGGRAGENREEIMSCQQKEMKEVCFIQADH